MARIGDTIRKSYEAAADLSSSQFTFVAIHATTDTITQAGAGARAFPLMDDPASGEAGSVALAGVAKVMAAADINAMVEVTSDASGHMVAASTGDEILGLTLEPVLDNAYGQILIIPVGTA
jgi:L-serine deaminase